MDEVTVPLLPSGEIQFRVQRNDGKETVHTIDVFTAKLACEECETKHKLATTEDDRIIPTVAFIDELASRFESIGVDDCTPTIAWLVWTSVESEFAKLKKNMSETPQ